MAEIISGTHCTYHEGMASLSGLDKYQRSSPISVLTGLDVV